jgi:hypothetical protein
MRPVVRVAALSALALSVLAAPAARGQTSPARTLVPYQGQLEKDGAPVNGAVDVRVGLFTTTTGSPQTCLALSNITGCGIWADEFLSTQVVTGRFTVTLGSGAALPASLFQNAPLYIGVAVRPWGGPPYTSLNGLQQLQSVPYAVLSLTGPDFSVDGNLSVGGATTTGGALSVGGNANVTGRLGVGIAGPQTALHVENGEARVRASHNDPIPIAQVLSNNLTQGLSLGPNRLGTVGSNANQDIFITPRGSGLVQVEGPMKTQATRNSNGTTSSYMTSLRRYLVEAPYSAANPVRSYVVIPHDVLTDLCSDEDGCRVTIRMRDWHGAGGAYTSRTAVSLSMHFDYGVDVGGRRTWRREAIAASPNTYIALGPENANDNDTTTNHVVQNHDCFFTDGSYTVGGSDNGDHQLGMGLLNYNATSGAYTPLCQLIIDD